MYRVAVTFSPPPKSQLTELQSGKLARTQPGSTFHLVPRIEVIETGLNCLYLQVVA